MEDTMSPTGPAGTPQRDPAATFMHRILSARGPAPLERQPQNTARWAPTTRRPRRSRIEPEGRVSDKKFRLFLPRDLGDDNRPIRMCSASVLDPPVSDFDVTGGHLAPSRWEIGPGALDSSGPAAI